ncbi:hypothetical protein BKA03_002131 [Demequina lutea]|uniref:Uncharacterized protein n=1 Tax=Demequina lutea TaxID=431489 RepID=A0A7Y9ZAX7_9MICO|nr:hypothetical protein [Demequina lutea]
MSPGGRSIPTLAIVAAEVAGGQHVLLRHVLAHCGVLPS